MNVLGTGYVRYDYDNRWKREKVYYGKIDCYGGGYRVLSKHFKTATAAVRYATEVLARYTRMKGVEHEGSEVSV